MEYIATIEPLAILFIVIGYALIILETQIPGFGLAGILGSASLIGGIIVQANSFIEAAILFGVVFGITLIIFTVFIRSVKKGRISKSNMILNSKEEIREGYTASRNDASLIGKTGITTTALRPAGAIDVEGKRIDVLTEGNFLEAGILVKITKVEGRRIIVEKTK